MTTILYVMNVLRDIREPLCEHVPNHHLVGTGEVLEERRELHEN